MFSFDKVSLYTLGCHVRFFYHNALHIILVSGEHLHMRFRCATNLTQTF